MSKEVKYLKLYSDGGSVNNGKKNKDEPVYGAYCYIVTTHKTHRIIKKYTNVYEDVTNNQMELLGVIDGIKYIISRIKKDKRNYILNLEVISDSQYVIKGCSEWLKNWKKNKWKDLSKKPIKNLDLWKEMDNILTSNKNLIDFNFTWVRGHSGKSNSSIKSNPNNYFNEQCDTLLSEQLKPYR